MPPHVHGPRTLALIAVFKFFKSALLVVLAFALLHLRHPQVSEHFVSWLRAFPFATGHQLISQLIETILGTTERTIGVFGGIALGYAVLYAIEGFGLWRNAHWAEYLTVVTTSLLVPIEIWEIFRHPTALKWLTLVINLAIVAYLVHLLRAERHGRANGKSVAGSPSRSS
jgi:uncharacterized membrane protein (DUF2068 family)